VDVVYDVDRLVVLLNANMGRDILTADLCGLESIKRTAVRAP
jgi:hypothetical protein